MNPQKRASALSAEQIAYIKGCAKLQIAVWRICHSSPLKALSDKTSINILRQAIMTLMEVRERNKKQAERSTISIWFKIA